MKKIFLVLFVIYTMTLSVKADVNNQYVSLTTNLKIKRSGSQALFIESYKKDSVYNDTLNKNGSTMYHLDPPEKVIFFTVKNYIPDYTMIQAYNIYKERLFNKQPMPIYDDSYKKSCWSKWYLSRTDSYTRKQVVINEKEKSMSYKDLSREEHHFSIFSYLLLIVISIFGLFSGFSYHIDDDELIPLGIVMTVLFFILAIVELIFLGISFNEIEMLLSVVALFMFIVGGLCIQSGKQIFKFIACVACSSVLLFTCYFQYNYYFGDTFIPKLGIYIYIIITLLAYVIIGLDKYDSSIYWLCYELPNNEFWKKIQLKLKIRV